ncbi:uncharacterized protein LOC131284935 [Anopheles ziemanni]|uniref:uncharacterized protein LOC131262441 n=1 Tax=Anopheles coustani TaxID=139045 RepID=UPI00265A5DDD|nr:uncharacterized protein LOC131262441 [Anopheles coustani]XP_058169777.1 uncharacterized protein LOC131284935 [Anopheles ziemanni]
MEVYIKLFLLAALVTKGQSLDVVKTKQVTEYVRNITLAVNEGYRGTVVCWILQFSLSSTSSLVQNSLAQDLFLGEEMVLLQADLSTEYEPTYLTPTVVVIVMEHLDEIVTYRILEAWLLAIPYHSIVLILFKANDLSQVPLVAKTLFSHGILNVIMIAYNVDAVYTFDYNPVRPTLHAGFPTVEKVLYDRLFTLGPTEVDAVYVENVYTFESGNVSGEDIMLFKLFFEWLGIRCNVIKLICSLSEPLVNCLPRVRSIILMPRLFYANHSTRMVDGIEMVKLAILAPRGAPISISSMVLKPFSPGVWIALLALCLLSCLGHHAVPNLLQNNLFSLALFGFEKRNLRFTGRCEKLFAVAMIILLFQLKCAYETFVISYGIERPTEPDPRTIRDLKERNIPLFINNLTFDLEAFNLPLDGVQLKFGIVGELNRLSILSFRYELELLAVDIANFDPTNGKQRLDFLEQTFPERLAVFEFEMKSIYQHHFAKFRRTVFEAGLQQRWRQMGWLFISLTIRDGVSQISA